MTSLGLTATASGIISASSAAGIAGEGSIGTGFGRAQRQGNSSGNYCNLVSDAKLLQNHVMCKSNKRDSPCGMTNLPPESRVNITNDIG